MNLTAELSKLSRIRCVITAANCCSQLLTVTWQVRFRSQELNKIEVVPRSKIALGNVFSFSRAIFFRRDQERIGFCDCERVIASTKPNFMSTKGANSCQIGICLLAHATNSGRGPFARRISFKPLVNNSFKPGSSGSKPHCWNIEMCLNR